MPHRVDWRHIDDYKGEFTWLVLQQLEPAHNPYRLAQNLVSWAIVRV